MPQEQCVESDVLQMSNGTKKNVSDIGAGGGGAWGSITGTISDQADLQDALDGKSGTGHGHAQADVTGLVSDLAAKEASANKGAASGYAPLDATSKVPTANLGGAGADNTKYLRGDQTWQVPAGGGGLGYAINVQALTSSPADGATIYFGMLPKAPVTAAATSKVYVRKAGTIKIAEIYCYSGTAGTAEAWSLYVRKNNTTDYLIATLSVSASERVFSNAGLSIAMAAGDYFELKSVNPTWVTNPLTCIFGGYIYIE